MIDPVHFEILPFGKGEAEAAELPERVRLTVTCSPKHGLDESIGTATRLRALGHSVTLHLAARMVRGPDHLDELLDRMKENGIDDAFVIGGDATPPHGPYASSVELLPIIHEHPRRPVTIGIGGYPEGHPLIDHAALAEALAQKAPMADAPRTREGSCAGSRGIRATASAGYSPECRGLRRPTKPARDLDAVGVGPSLSFPAQATRPEKSPRGLGPLADSASYSLSAERPERRRRFLRPRCLRRNESDGPTPTRIEISSSLVGSTMPGTPASTGRSMPVALIPSIQRRTAPASKQSWVVT